MNPRAIQDIQEGEALFREAEATFPSQRSAHRFREVFDTLNAYVLEEVPDPPIAIFVANLKYAYTRRVLDRLQEIPLQQVDVLVPYVSMLFFSAKQEFDALHLSHPDLAREFDACLERFRPQLEDIVREARRAPLS